MNSNLRIFGRQAAENERSVSSIVHELADEGKSFIGTRAAMLISEMRENLNEWKSSFPMLAVGFAFVVTAWLVLTGGLIAAIWGYFAPNPFATFFSCAIVGSGYLLLGGMFVFTGRKAMRGKSLLPRRTLKVLKDDSEWIQREAVNR